GRGASVAPMRMAASQSTRFDASAITIPTSSTPAFAGDRALTRLPHPLVLLLMGVAVCAALTWVLPPGEYDGRDDPETGRRVVVAGTYHRVAPAPVGPFAAVVAIPRGFVDAAEVIGVVLFVGAAWFVVDRIGTLPRLIGALVARFEARGLIAIPIISVF